MQNQTKESVFIFDIDGTIALTGDRNIFDFKKVGLDTVNEDVRRVYTRLKQMWNIILVTGRPESCRAETEEWLTKNYIPFNGLIMRKDGDKRDDYIFKQEVYNTILKDRYNVLGVFDDRDSAVKAWRDLGLTCFQVAYGNF